MPVIDVFNLIFFYEVKYNSQFNIDKMADKAEIVFNKCLDFQKLYRENCKPRLRRILPRNNSTPTINTTGGDSTVFEIPSDCYNFHNSILQFTMTPAAAPGAGKIYWTHLDTVSLIREIHLTTQRGVQIVFARHANNFLKTVVKYYKTHDDYSNQSINYRADSLRGSPFVYNNESRTFDTNKGVENRISIRPVPTGASVLAHVNYFEPKYLQVSNADNNTNPAFTVELKLGDIAHTFFALDKEFYFGETLELEIIWDGANRAYFYNDLSGGMLQEPYQGTPTAASSVNLSNLELWIQRETNPEMIQGLKQYSQNGMLIPFEFYVSKKQNLNSAAQNVRHKISPSDGFKLKRVYHSLFANTESGVFAFDNHSNNDDKVKTYHTELDNVHLQDVEVDTSDFKDWYFNRDLIKGSAVQTANVYQYNWVHIDAWDSMMVGEKDKSYIIEGMDLDKEHTWVFDSTTENSSFNHYTFFVCMRYLMLGPGEISVFMQKPLIQ